MARDYRMGGAPEINPLEALFKMNQGLTDQNKINNEAYQEDANRKAALDRIQKQHDLDEQGAKNRLAEVLNALKTNQVPDGAGISVTQQGASVTRQPTMGLYDARHEQQVRHGMSEYSKRLEKLNGFNAALNDIESLTNRTGKGGVISNPSEVLKSTGAAKSAVPTSLLGLGEMVGMVDKGTAEERKALERLQLEYQKSMTGMRTSEEMSQREKQAMGWMASGDPKLVAKGIRSLAHNVSQAHRSIRAGYMPDVQQGVEDQLGNQFDLLDNVYQDPAIPLKSGPTKSPGQVLQQLMPSQPQQQPTAPMTPQAPQQQAPSSEEQEYLMLRKKHKGF